MAVFLFLEGGGAPSVLEINLCSYHGRGTKGILGGPKGCYFIFENLDSPWSENGENKTLFWRRRGFIWNCNEEFKAIYSNEKLFCTFFSRAQVHFRGPAPHHPSPSSPWLPSLGFRLFMSAAFPLTKAIETLFWSCQIYCSVPSMMTTKELIEISPGAGKIRENLIWTVIPTVKMAQMVSAGETTFYFQREYFSQLSAGLRASCGIVAPITFLQ